VRSILKRALNKSIPGIQHGGRPPAAVELSPQGVLAAALPASGDPPVYAFVPLPAGAIVPGIGEPNLRAVDAVSGAIRSALDQVSPRTRAVTLVLPDTAVRVFMLDFDSLPDTASEAVSVLRFRLRKMVPFDVEHAGVSYQVLSRNASEWKVLTAVLPGLILAEYEAAVRAAGYEPGAVLPSSLAALEAVDSMEAVLSANLSPIALTTSIANGSDLLLHRTLDLPEEPAHRISEIQLGIAVATAYFEDKLQAPPTTLHYAGSYEAAEFASWIDNPSLTVVDLAPRPETGALTALGAVNIAGAAGALAGAS
jgi:type IV pilus assembly protein PilM